MRLTFPRAPAWPRWAVAVAAAWLGLVGLVQLAAPGFLLCPLRCATGVPCPGCGVTRGVTAVLRGDVARGLAFNPLAVTAVLAIAGLLAAWVLLGRVPRLELQPRERRVVWAAGILLLVANWAHVIARAG